MLIVKSEKDVPGRSGLASTHTRDVHYAYDLYGNLTAATFDSTSGEGLSFAYDALGRVTSATTDMDSTARTLSYQYDVAGRQTRITHPDAAYFTYTHDRLNRVTKIENSIGTVLVRDAFDNLGYPKRRLRDGAAPDDWYYYDAAKRLDEIFTDSPTASKDVRRSWTFNPASQVVAETIDHQDHVWDGHVVTDVTYTANGLNQLTAAGSNTLTYDANGNLAGDGSNTYTYDTENRMVVVTGQNEGDLRYDPFGRLYEVEDDLGNITRFALRWALR